MKQLKKTVVEYYVLLLARYTVYILISLICMDPEEGDERYLLSSPSTRRVVCTNNVQPDRA